MKKMWIVMCLALTLLGCDDATAREIEILSLGEPQTDVERVEVAYAYNRQVGEHTNALDRAAMSGDPELDYLARTVGDLDRVIAEAGHTPESPGALSTEARAAAFRPDGQFVGDRTVLHMNTQSIAQATEAVYMDRDISRRHMIMYGAIIVVPVVGGAFLLGIVALGKLRKKRPSPQPSSR